MRQRNPCRSSALRRLQDAAARAGICPEQRDDLLAAVLAGLAAQMSNTQWREACEWLPWDVRSLAGVREVSLVIPRDDLSNVVAAATGLSRPVAVVAVRTVLAELARILPPAALPHRVTTGVPGL